MVTVCMIIIFFVWIFSLQDLMDNDQDKINSGSEILGDMEKLEKTEILGEQMNQSEQMNPPIQP